MCIAGQGKNKRKKYSDLSFIPSSDLPPTPLISPPQMDVRGQATLATQTLAVSLLGHRRGCGMHCGTQDRGHPWPNNIDDPSLPLRGPPGQWQAPNGWAPEMEKFPRETGQPAGKSFTSTVFFMMWVDFYSTLCTKRNSKWIKEKINVTLTLKETEVVNNLRIEKASFRKDTTCRSSEEMGAFFSKMLILFYSREICTFVYQDIAVILLIILKF